MQNGQLNLPTLKGGGSLRESVARTKRKREEAFREQHGTGTLVAQHYNQVAEAGGGPRSQSSLYPVRKFHNWIKATLLHQCLHRNPKSRVLDMACGKGGDLGKYSDLDVTYYCGVDISAASIEEAKQRYRRASNMPFKADFSVMDCCLDILADRLHPSILFDFVSCQFALHYSFESEKRAKTMLRNISERLSTGGRFVATIPDSRVLVSKLRSASEGTFGTSAYTITFCKVDGETPHHFANMDNLFGIKYHFHMEGSVDCPEFLVHIPTLKKLAAEVGLELVSTENFHQYYTRVKGRYPELDQRYKLGQNPESYTVGEWDASYIYMVVTFTKKEHQQSFDNT